METPAGKLSGKTAIVTGAARGIGLAICGRLAADGAGIVAFDMAGAPWADCRAAVQAAGMKFEVLEGDVSSATDWMRAVELAKSAFGGLDIVVNNAGISGPIAPICDYPLEAFDRVMAVNVRGVFLGLKIGGQAIAGGGRGGAIINISSVSGVDGSRKTSAYTASKHAVLGLTKSAALDLVALGVRVNAVCPAPTATDMVFDLEKRTAPEKREELRKKLTSFIPMGRYGMPEEVAAAVAFLAGPESSFMTGSAMMVDGGTAAG